jgi:hypothetical protein
MVTHRAVGLELVDVIYNMEHGVLCKVGSGSENHSVPSRTSL